eukprot:g11094.t1
MSEWEQPRERAEWTHPRRAAKEIITYLSQVEPVIDQFAQDDHSYGAGGGDDEEDDDDNDVGREQMMDNILEELKHQTASIMEDRQGSVVAEKIARRLTPLQLRTMLSRCRGYMLSLANNRYSSHVLQTLLSVAGPVVEAELSEDGDAHSAEAGDEVDRMQDVVLSLVSELSGAWAELLADISGSHVGRGFLQVLGGLPILSEKRGRQSRHAHSIGTAVGPARMGGRNSSSGNMAAAAAAAKSKGSGSSSAAVDPEALEKWSTPYKHRVPRSFVAALGEVTSELAALPPRELQTLACGTFGCPLLVMLLRVHSNLSTATAPAAGNGDDEEQRAFPADLVMAMPCLEQESAAMRIVRKVLEWDDQERSAEVVYAISGENTASHFLEAVLWLSPRAFFQELYHRCFEDKLLEFCEHGVSNFLIQAALQRADDKALAEKMVGAIADNASELLKARRAGVLWRAAQACVRLGLKPKTQTKLLEHIAVAVQAGHTGAPPQAAPPASSGDADEDDEGEGRGQDGTLSSAPAAADAFKAARAWVPALLSPRLPREGGLDRLFLNVPGARIVQNALLFDPPVAAPVLKAVAALPEDLLAAIARDNMGSRCLLDPILEAAGGRGGGRGAGGGKGKNKPAEDARRAILRAFRGHLVAMACDRVAWHILVKCFRGVDMKEKRAMAEELGSGGEQAWSRMSGYPSGRSVLTECMVERYSRSPHEWEEAFKSRDNRDKMLTEIFAVESSSKSSSSSSSTRQAGGKAGKDGVAGGSADGGGGGNGRQRAAGLAPSPFNSQASNGEDGGRGKEKRRRQRGRGKRGKSSASGGLAPDSGADGGGDAGAAESGDAPEPPGDKPTTGKRKKRSESESRGHGSQAEAAAVDAADEDDAAGATSKKKKRKNKANEESSARTEGGGEAPAPEKIWKNKMKMKRRHQESGSTLDEHGVNGGDQEGGVGTAAAAGDSEGTGTEADALVGVHRAATANGDMQAQIPTTTKNKKTKTKKKIKIKHNTEISGEGGEAGGGKGAEGTAAESEVPVGKVDGADGKDEGVGGKKGKKKKVKTESKAGEDDEPKWKAVKTPPKRNGSGVVAVEEPKAVGSSGKKKRKSGFRLF